MWCIGNYILSNILEPTGSSLEVFASLTANIHSIKLEFQPICDDSDDEDMYIALEQQLTGDYINLLNNTNRVKKILLFFDRNCQNEKILVAFIRLSHNLLLVHKDAIRKYM